MQQFSRRKGEANGQWKTFSENILYFEKDLLDDNTYDEIIGWINDKATEWNAKPTVIFYLAVAPQLAPGIAKNYPNKKFVRIQNTPVLFLKNHLVMI